jgi:hypothetical protein
MKHNIHKKWKNVSKGHGCPHSQQKFFSKSKGITPVEKYGKSPKSYLALKDLLLFLILCINKK